MATRDRTFALSSKRLHSPSSLAPPAPTEGAASEEEVGNQGLAVDDLEAALKASVTETKGRPSSPFFAGGGGGDPASALAEA